jgi:MFS family permease
MRLGLVVGLSADHWGLRKCMLMGLSLMFFSSCLGGLAPDATTLLVLRGVEGLGFLLVVTPAPGLIRQNVAPAELNARMGGWGTYMSFGSALGLLLGPIIMGLWNWTTWWMFAGGVSFLAWLAVWVVVPRPVSRPTPLAPQETLAAVAGWRDRLGRTLTTPGPWLIAFAFAVYTGQWMSVIGFLPTIYTQNHISWGMTGVLTALVALVNFFEFFKSAELAPDVSYVVLNIGAQRTDFVIYRNKSIIFSKEVFSFNSQLTVLTIWCTVSNVSILYNLFTLTVPFFATCERSLRATSTAITFSVRSFKLLNKFVFNNSSSSKVFPRLAVPLIGFV